MKDTCFPRQFIASVFEQIHTIIMFVCYTFNVHKSLVSSPSAAVYLCFTLPWLPRHNTRRKNEPILLVSALKK